MSIIFDENKEDTFRGEYYPFFNFVSPEKVNFYNIQKEIRELLSANSTNSTIIIRFNKETPYSLLYAALANIEGQNFPKIERIVFKVDSYKDTLEKYKTFFSFTIAMDYVLRLLKMNKIEMYKDIESLSYLGLDVKTDYLKDTITLRHVKQGKKYTFNVSSLENTVILASFIKMVSLIDTETNLNIEIVLHKIPENNEYIFNKDKICKKLFWCAKPFLLNQIN